MWEDFGQADKIMLEDKCKIITKLPRPENSFHTFAEYPHPLVSYKGNFLNNEYLAINYFVMDMN